MLATLVLLAQASSAHVTPHPRAAVERALPALERSAKAFVANRSCVSCHHNILPILVFRLAAGRGFTIDRATLASVERKTFRELTNARAFDEAVQGANVSDPTPNDSWLLIAAHGGRSRAEPDERGLRQTHRERGSTTATGQHRISGRHTRAACSRPRQPRCARSVRTSRTR